MQNFILFPSNGGTLSQIPFCVIALKNINLSLKNIFLSRVRCTRRTVSFIKCIYRALVSYRRIKIKFLDRVWKKTSLEISLQLLRMPVERGRTRNFGKINVKLS